MHKKINLKCSKTLCNFLGCFVFFLNDVIRSLLHDNISFVILTFLWSQDVWGINNYNPCNDIWWWHSIKVWTNTILIDIESLDHQSTYHNYDTFQCFTNDGLIILYLIPLISFNIFGEILIQCPFSQHWKVECLMS